MIDRYLSNLDDYTMVAILVATASYAFYRIIKSCGYRWRRWQRISRWVLLIIITLSMALLTHGQPYTTPILLGTMYGFVTGWIARKEKVYQYYQSRRKDKSSHAQKCGSTR